MKKIVFIVFISVIIYSCEKYPEPGFETLESFNFNISGNNQSAEAGEYLAYEIGAQIDLASLVPQSDKKFYLELEVVEGGGITDAGRIEADSEGKMLTRWKLGDTNNDQLIRGRIYDSSDRLYSVFNIKAAAFFMDKLNTVSRGFLLNITDMVRDTLKHQSMMLSGGWLYVKESFFYDWRQIDFPSQTRPAELEINSKGDIFAGDYNGELYKSKDWGANWTPLGRPIPGHEHHFELSISKDDYIWANNWGKGVYCSKDDGASWTKDTIGLEVQERLGRVYSFADTSHLAISHNKSAILQSVDDGLSWHPINSPQFTQTMFVTDDNSIIAQNIHGFTLNKSTDAGESYKFVFNSSVANGFPSSDCYDKFEDYYYFIAPAGGVWKTKDYEEFEKIISLELQSKLFIDHSGTIYASGFNYSNSDPDPTLILPATN